MIRHYEIIDEKNQRYSLMTELDLHRVFKSVREIGANECIELGKRHFFIRVTNEGRVEKYT